MQSSENKRETYLNRILDHMRVAVTLVDTNGVILYANAAAMNRPTRTPRKVGRNIRDCHKPKTNEKIDTIFQEFRDGRREPHHYLSTASGRRELVTIIPIFDGDAFSACLSHIHTLDMEGPERTFS
ncbi:MAG: PAS domain-containing protein [Deltaproteobacteria bacterium]|jgi:PAS domain S-box-containing protein